MKHTGLSQRMRSYITMIIMVVMAMLAAGCSKDNENINSDDDDIIGPDENGWCEYKDKAKRDIVHEGTVHNADLNGVIVYSISEKMYYYCVNISNKICDEDDELKFKIKRFHIGPYLNNGGQLRIEVELLNVKKK